MGKAVVLNTGDSIIAKLAGAVATTQPTWTSGWVDTTGDTTAGGKGALNGASEVALVAAPGADQRQVDFCRIYNEDTAAIVVTVQVANGASRYTLGKWALAPTACVDVLDPAEMIAGSNYEVPLTFGDNLTRTLNDVDLDADIAINSATFATAITDNTATTKASTTAYAKAQNAVLRRHPTQAVGLTYAASGSTGITVADNDNLDFGTGNFSLGWTGSLPDWDLAAVVVLLQKIQAGFTGYSLYITSSVLTLRLYNANTGTGYSSTSPILVTDGTTHHLSVVVTRESAAVAGSIVFYVDGVQLGDAVAISAGVPPSYSNSGALSIFGSSVSTVRYSGTCSFVAAYNRALTAADVLDLYRNGIVFADKWGSQTSIITGNDSTFAGASNWANVDIDAYDETTDGVLTLTASAAAQYCTLPIANATTVTNKKYRIEFDCPTLTATWTIKDFGGTVTIGTVSATGTAQKIEFTASTTGGLRLVAVANNSAATFDNFLLYEIGVTLALQPEGIQREGWYGSANGLIATYPAAGCTFAGSMDDPRFQGAANVETTGAVTLTLAKLLTRLIQGSPSDARAYTLDTGANMDSTGIFAINEFFDWSLQNLDTTAADIITVTGTTGHTVEGLMTVQANHATTGAVGGTTGRFRTRKTAASTFITYRLA